MIDKKSGTVKEIRHLLKSLKIKYKINWKSQSSYALPADSFIYIGSYKCSLNNFLSTVFHEVAHILNYRDKKYFIYHNVGRKSIVDEAFRKNFSKVALKAERFTDKRACKLMKEYYPEVNFIHSYRTNKEVNSLKKKY